MTTTADNGTALAVRKMTDKQIRTRMDLNRQAGYGLEKATTAQLNIIFLLCQRYKLDPVSDITLFEGRPFITIDGRLRLLRRHAEYRGFDCRPMRADEKVMWGYESDDIVVEACIRTATWGEIKARGKVTRAEVDGARERAERDRRRPAPIGVHPVEIAEKRAIARAERAAFGQDALPDDDEIEAVVTEIAAERRDPERNKALAADYDRIIGTDEDWDRSATPPPTARDQATADPDELTRQVAGAVLTEEQRPPPSREDLWAENRALVKRAAELKLTGVPTLPGRSGENVVAEANEVLRERIRNVELDQKLAVEQQGAR